MPTVYPGILGVDEHLCQQVALLQQPALAARFIVTPISAGESLTLGGCAEGGFLVLDLAIFAADDCAAVAHAASRGDITTDAGDLLVRAVRAS